MATKRKKKLYEVQWWSAIGLGWMREGVPTLFTSLEGAERRARAEARSYGVDHRIIEHRPVKVVRVVRAKR